MHSKRKIVISIIVLLLAVLGGGCAYLYHTVSVVAGVKTICEGVVVDGCKVGGLDVEQAIEAVTDWEEKRSEKEVTITYEDHTEKRKLKQLGYECSASDIKSAVRKAYNIGKEGSMWARYRAIKKGVKEHTPISVKKTVKKGRFNEYIQANADRFIKVAKNAALKRKDGSFVITDEQNGMKVPINKNVKALNNYLNQNWDGEAFEYELKVDVAKPEYTREDLEKVKDVLGTYTTNFSTSPYNRIENIKNACKKINGRMIYPGETFSVMDIILPFTPENGYYEAGSYASGEVIQSYGGGVCQVATTLYNTVLLAELEVAERHNHQMAVSYVPLSQDAAVSDTGNQDFKFVNNTDTPLYLEGYVDGYNITFTLYGCETRDSNRKVEYVSERTATIQPGKDIQKKDNTLPEGKQIVTQGAHVGYRARLWKCVYENEELKDKTQINSSYYAASPRRVTVGTKKSEKDKDKEDDKKKDDKTEDAKNRKDTTKSSRTDDDSSQSEDADAQLSSDKEQTKENQTQKQQNASQNETKQNSSNQNADKQNSKAADTAKQSKNTSDKNVSDSSKKSADTKANADKKAASDEN